MCLCAHALAALVMQRVQLNQAQAVLAILGDADGEISELPVYHAVTLYSGLCPCPYACRDLQFSSSASPMGIIAW